MQISMNIPCAESTVYRAIRRVKDFLNESEANTIWDTVKKELSEYAPNFGEAAASSVLEMMYETYADHNRIEPDDVQPAFRELRFLLNGMPYEPTERVFAMVCDLCYSHERAGFTEGVKLGVHLADELR